MRIRLQMHECSHRRAWPLLIEHPEDLGGTSKGSPRAFGHWRTGSPWSSGLVLCQWPFPRAALGKTLPSRRGSWALFSTSPDWAGESHFTWGKAFTYQGPLPRKCHWSRPHRPTAGHDSLGFLSDSIFSSLPSGTLQSLGREMLATGAGCSFG